MAHLSEVLLLAILALAFAAMKWHAAGSRAPGAPSPREWPVFRPGALALQDWLVVGYLATLWCLVFFGDGERRPTALRWISLDVTAFAVLLTLGRFANVPRRVADIAYRFALPGAIVTTFTQLHYLLPTARSSTFDAEIYALDHRIFGFAFFYYLYFAIVLIHVVPMAALETRMPVLREFSWGIFWVFCVGQLIYVAVPAYGPYRYLGPSFHHALEGPRFWPLVAKTVASFDGAHRTDVFPSLHTAVPTFFTLFSFRHRDKLPFRYTWPVLAFVTGNIIIATMFLRWHYLLDICAGLTLATTAIVGAAWIPAREDAWRAKFGLQPIWRPIKADVPPSLVPVPVASSRT